MKTGLSDQVRSVARSKYVDSALASGRREFSIPVQGMLETLAPLGFPKQNVPQICTSLQTGKFLKENNLKIIRVDGPPKKQSTTVVIHYRRLEGSAPVTTSPASSSPSASLPETAEAKASRLCGSLRGILRKEITAAGGAEAFLQSLRPGEGENA